MNTKIETPVDHNFHQLDDSTLIKWEQTRPAAYHEYRRSWVENPKQQILGRFPLHLDIEATGACNLRCTMCPRTKMIKEGTFWTVRSFPMEAYRALIDQGVDAGLCSIKFNYLGEPTLNKHLVEMIEYAKKAGVLDVMFNTNGTTLNEELSRRLIASGLDKLFFSFDSAHKEKFEAIRIGASYDQVIGNIRGFMKIRNEMGSISPFTRVSMVLMKDNENEWEEFRNLFEPIVDAVAYVDYIDHSNQEDPDRMIVDVGSREGRFCCPQLWQRMFVHADGVVTPCCLDSARELRMGNIFKTDAEQIWTGDEYTKIRNLHANGRIDEIETCARCPLAQY